MHQPHGHQAVLQAGVRFFEQRINVPEMYYLPVAELSEVYGLENHCGDVFQIRSSSKIVINQAPKTPNQFLNNDYVHPHSIFGHRPMARFTSCSLKMCSEECSLLGIHLAYKPFDRVLYTYPCTSSSTSANSLVNQMATETSTTVVSSSLPLFMRSSITPALKLYKWQLVSKDCLFQILNLTPKGQQLVNAQFKLLGTKSKACFFDRFTEVSSAPQVTWKGKE